MRAAFRKALSSKRVAQRISITSPITTWTRGCCKVSLSLVEPRAKTRSVSGGQVGGVIPALVGNNDMGIGAGVGIDMVALTSGDGLGIGMATLTRGNWVGIGMGVPTRGNKVGVGVAMLTRGNKGVGMATLTTGDVEGGGMAMWTGGDSAGTVTPTGGAVEMVRPPAEGFQDSCCQSSCELKIYGIHC